MSRREHRIGRLGRIAVPTLTLLLLVGLAEVGFRAAEAIAVRRVGESWATYDPDLGYRLNPGHRDINAHGLRDRPVTPKNGRFRVLMLGDSLGFYGDTVDDTYVGRLRTHVQRKSGPAVDVLNASVKGYTNYQQLLFLKKYGLALEPDLVGVGFVLNDLHRILHQFRVENGRIVGETYSFTPEALGSVAAERWLVRTAKKSHVLRWARGRLGTVTAAFEYRAQGGYAFDYRPDVNTAWKDAAWPAIESQLGEMQAVGRRHRFELFVVVFPLADQYRAEYLARDRVYVMKPQRRLAAICERLALKLLDLYPHLDASCFEADRVHLTADGRERAARVIVGFLDAERLVTP